MANALRPNVLWILCDQQPWNALGCYGNPQVLTPNIDRLALQGCRFTHGFAQSMQKRAARASVLTSLYPARLGRLESPAAASLPRLLRDASYRSFALGSSWDTDDGFDTVDEVAQVQNSEGTSPQTRNAAATDKALEFIRADAGRPFFCAITYSPDVEDVPESCMALYEPGKLASFHPTQTHEYYAAISEIDACCGKLLRELERMQLAESTIVVYAGLSGWDADPKSLANGFVPSNAVRVPVIVRGPADCVQAGIVCESVVEQVDIAPTMLELLGVAIPPAMQGLSFRAVLAGESRHHRAAAITELADWIALHTQQFQYCVRYDGRERLYDLGQAPRSMSDVSEEMRYRGALVENRHRMVTRLIQANYR